MANEEVRGDDGELGAEKLDGWLEDDAKFSEIEWSNYPLRPQDQAAQTPS